MVIPWETRGELVLDRDGLLWTPYRRGWHWLGPIEDAAVPPELEDARAELLDLWLDSFDPRVEQLAAYQRSVLG